MSGKLMIYSSPARSARRELWSLSFLVTYLLLEIFIDVSEYEFGSLSKALKQICSVCISEVHHNSDKRLKTKITFLSSGCAVLL